MADAAISFAIEKLGDALINKVSFLIDVEDQVKLLIDELNNMRCFLKDAADKQGNDERIRQWIRDVREVAQDAEDAIEIFSIKVDTRKNRGLLGKCVCFPVHICHLNRVGEEIESIKTRLLKIRERRETYGIGNLGEVGINESSLGSRSEIVEMRRRILNDKDVVGLDKDTGLLLKEVILNEKKKGLFLAAIVGMGGIGKSTLARKIYNHPAVAAGFEKRAWVVVSSEFTVEDIMKQIMHELSLPLDTDELKTLESIQDKLRRQGMLQDILRKRLEGKHYFIVLDDVWEAAHWELALKNAFPDQQDKGSRMLFTSRNQIITEQSGYVHNMRPLSSDESWQLLLKMTFKGKSEEVCTRELEDVGKEISKKCHGLPLVITVAGGLLMNQGKSKSEWEIVLKQIKNYDSETSEIGRNVSTILELSYHNLPSELKPCFLCLAFFKEDEVIQAKKLVHIWAALGLVQAGQESVEEIGMRYLDRLIKRNLILVKGLNTDDGVRYCHAHDLLLDLSIRKAKEEIGFESLSSEGCSSSPYKPRHRVVRGIREKLVHVDTSNQNKHLRTLFLHAEVNYGCCKITPSYWKGLELLRILDIDGEILWKLPSEIRASMGIRYLRLRMNFLELRLPSWLDVLKNLEVLEIDGEHVIFPNVTWKMDSLRHLYIPHFSLFHDSMKKTSWKNLETLKNIRSDNLASGDNPIQGLSPGLRKLGVFLENREEKAEMWILIDESAVQALHLEWTRPLNSPVPIPIYSLHNLTKLKLKGPMDSFPWSADNFPQNITHLTLTHSEIKGYAVMPILLGKLPNLLVLKLNIGAISVNTLRIKVSHEGFPRLEVLHLRNLHLLEYIEIEEGGLPQLQQLHIYKCTDLRIANLRAQIRSGEIVVTGEHR